MHCISNLFKPDVNKSCVTYKNIVRTQALLNNTPFDDGGAVLAYSDALSNYQAECMLCERCIFSTFIE